MVSQQLEKKIEKRIDEAKKLDLEAKTMHIAKNLGYYKEEYKGERKGVFKEAVYSYLKQKNNWLRFSCFTKEKINGRYDTQMTVFVEVENSDKYQKVFIAKEGEIELYIPGIWTKTLENVYEESLQREEDKLRKRWKF